MIRLGSSALLLALPLLAPALVAVPRADLEALVVEELANAPARTPDEIWERAMMLREAAAVGAPDELDKVLDEQLEREDLSPEARLLLTASRLQGDDPDPAVLHGALSDLLASADEPLAMAAAGLLSNDVFRRLKRADREALGKELVDGARNADRSPEYRIRFATTASRVGGGTEIRQAKREMHAFLESSDPELRALGALGLAAAREEIYGDLRIELEHLARLPNERGSLARSYIELERLREMNDRKVKELMTRLEDGDTMPKSLRDFVAVMQMIENYHIEGDRVSERDLIEAALDGMLHYMDEHSSFLSGETYAKFLLDLEAEYGGIGAYVGLDPNTGLFTINRPIYSGPAYRAGLMTDDRIVRIGDWPTLGKDVDEIIKRLKGKPATEVKLYVWRRGMDPDLIERPTEDMAVVLEREAIQIPAVAAQMLPGGIGMVELSTFSRNVHEELEATFEQMQAEGMRALIFDLRRNSGGLLIEARNVADLFLPRGKKVVSTEGIGRPEVHKTYRPAAIPEDMPIVVLVSRYTASASEIVSGALKDHQRAVILGENTFGKGSVQQLMPVLGVEEDAYEDRNQNNRWDQWEPITVDHNGNGKVDYAPRVKLTIARYLLPSGRSIHRELDEEGNVISEGGIEPDEVVRSPLIESWRYNERLRLRDARVARDYVDQHWEESHDLFRQLAVNDYKDASLYPGFDAFMAGLDTILPRDDVRMVLRNEIRRRIQDDRGAEFPPGDYVEDYQVQKAIELALKRFDESPESYEEYKRTFLSDEEIDDSHLVAVDVLRRERMRDAAALIRDIQDGSVEASPEKLAELLKILSEEDM